MFATSMFLSESTISKKWIISFPIVSYLVINWFICSL